MAPQTATGTLFANQRCVCIVPLHLTLSYDRTVISVSFELLKVFFFHLKFWKTENHSSRASTVYTLREIQA